MYYRVEKDNLREARATSDKLWGSQTQRNLENFKVGKGTMPIEVIREELLQS